VLPFEKVPRVVEKVREVPVATAAPVPSVNVAVMAEELEPSAGMLVSAAVSVIEAVWPTAPGAPSSPPGQVSHEIRRTGAKKIRMIIKLYGIYPFFTLFEPPYKLSA